MRALDASYLPENEPFEIRQGRVYYTKVNFWYEFETHSTTNYARGLLVPVNTRVVLLPFFSSR